jgi:hypothetical protein
VQLDVDICAHRVHIPWRCCNALQFAFTWRETESRYFGRMLPFIVGIPPEETLLCLQVSETYSLLLTVRSESRWSLIKGVGSDVHGGLYRPEPV